MHPPQRVYDIGFAYCNMGAQVAGLPVVTPKKMNDYIAMHMSQQTMQSPDQVFTPRKGVEKATNLDTFSICPTNCTVELS